MKSTRLVVLMASLAMLLVTAARAQTPASYSLSDTQLAGFARGDTACPLEIGPCKSSGSAADCGVNCSTDPWELFPETCRGIKVGGWFQAGYHNESTGLFNRHPGRLHLHQGYLYAEKVADGECGWDWGFRTDIVYGVDAQDTQAFGNNPGNWDYLNGWDHGIYGWAMPQFYGEVANGDLSVKFGHFYTLVGYEVVTAPGNFFYSHAFTMYNSEPFTHTGAIATYGVSENLDVYGGWTAGWDTGFDQFNGGSNFLGGFAFAVTDNVKMTYINTFGNLGVRGEGYSHSLVFDVTLTENLKYVAQNDLVATDTGTANDDVSINQYLIYTLNDCWAFGSRFEWWKRDGSPAYEATTGVNWKPNTNFLVRPEIRYQWGDGLVNNLGLADDSQWIFGVDGILSF